MNKVDQPFEHETYALLKDLCQIELKVKEIKSGYSRDIQARLKLYDLGSNFNKKVLMMKILKHSIEFLDKITF